MKKIKVALVGNTNSGKTTLINTVCGLHKETSNYPGTTVEICRCIVKDKDTIYEFSDLPGTYSLTSFSDEEKVTRDILLNEKFDLVIQVVEPTCKKRSLSFTLELMELSLPILVFLNQKKGEIYQVEEFLKQMRDVLGLESVTMNAQAKNTKDRLIEIISSTKISTAHYEGVVLKVHERFREQILGEQKKNKGQTVSVILRKLQERNFLKGCNMQIRKNRFHFLENNLDCFKCAMPTDRESNKICPFHKTDTIDSILLNKWLGFPLFLFVMWMVFEATFTFGSFPMDLMDSGFVWLQDFLREIMGQGLISSLLIDGVIGGIGATFIFIPQIIILFFFISIMKQSGYLARTACILDGMMKDIGLPGKSFVPLLMGFGCNVPAIMATRTLSTRRERIITSMMIPFMSCSARLPVFTLLISAFVPLNFRGSVMFGLYFLGIIMGIFTALLLNKLSKTSPRSLILELPMYSWPSMKNIWNSTWGPTKDFIKKAITVILPIALVLWLLFSFPRLNGETVPIHETYASSVGQSIEFLVEPLGFDWRIGTGILAGFAAKEVLVSTFALLYSIEEEDEQGLISKIQNDPVFTHATVASLLVFVLLYAPCMAVVATFRQEFGNKWACISFFYPTVLAWIIAFITYRIFLII